MKMHLRESRTSKFSGGACPRSPLGSKALRAYPLLQKLIETPVSPTLNTHRVLDLPLIHSVLNCSRDLHLNMCRTH